jgi:succinyl-diaminopimelate desuccinylase
MEVYRKNTGDEASKPMVIGGGTYARAIPNAVAFGPRFPDSPNLAHQTDEYAAVDDLMKITRIYADAMYKLTGGV